MKPRRRKQEKIIRHSGMQDPTLQLGRFVRVFPEQMDLLVEQKEPQPTIIDLANQTIDITGEKPKVGEAMQEFLGRVSLPGPLRPGLS